MSLSDINVGQKAIIKKVASDENIKRRLLDMGLTPRTKVMIRKVAPLGDPIELRLRGYLLTIRKEDAKQIEVSLWDTH